MIDKNKSIKFIYHVDLKNELFMLFNSKGRNMKIFNKLISSDDELTFPN